MAKQYKTPGVYVVEKNSFGSSIVANATAIPSFIGFTEFAYNSKGEPLNKVKGSSIVSEPVLVQSMLEYQNAFGGADETGRVYVKKSIDKDGKVVYTSENMNTDGSEEYTPGLMEPSVSNFFSNGGGSCYIISIGTYSDFATSFATKITGEMNFIEEAIQMAETTTLILPTDLLRFGTTNYYTWGTQLTNFSEQEKKYFTVMDVIQDGANDPVFEKEDIVNYRSLVTPEFPSYAGAYYPYLKSLTPYAYKADLSNVYLDGSPLLLGTSKSNEFKLAVKAGAVGSETAVFEGSYMSEDKTVVPEVVYAAATEPTAAPEASIVVEDNKLTVNYVADTSAADMNTLWKKQADQHPAWKLTFVGPTVDGAAVTAITQIALWKNAVPSAVFPFIASCNALTVTSAPVDAMKAKVEVDTGSAVETTVAISGDTLTITVPKDSTVKEAITAYKQGTLTVTLAANPLYLADKIAGGEETEMPKNNTSNATVEEVKTFLATNYINMPPSPFMAGIYSRLDNATGVWTPPANVSPTGVTGPLVQLTNKQQEDLNVDATAGKSVNAIRSFTGKGTLVWGARTNDGNSMDWRYVNVRRLFISMETDISMALEAYVFKPNVHNTWVEVKTNIESYLFGLFGQGAFAGTTPETSYQVLIGKGETMTDEDVLNGYMRVSIMVAPVRPAEFIVLTFSQMIGQ